MTNHIEKLQDKLSAIEDKSPHNRIPSEMQLLQIAAILALAQEVRHISNLMAGGAQDDIPTRVPAEAAQPLTADFDAAPSEVSVGLHNCTQTEARASCLGCPDAEGCVHMAQGHDDLLCKHIYTGHQHDEPMTQTQDSRDSAGFPRP